MVAVTWLLMSREAGFGGVAKKLAYVQERKDSVAAAWKAPYVGVCAMLKKKLAENQMAAKISQRIS
jgi:hypothetical protein